MKGYLTTCEGAEYALPTLLEWEICYTGSVPCDSFTLRCPYEAAMAETLRRAVRFTAREDGAVEFRGVIDEVCARCDAKRGLELELSGRGMAALLLDSEAEAVSYELATTGEIVRNHVTPWGVACGAWDEAECAGYRVANGASQWKAVNDFAALHAGLTPYFRKDGTLELKRARRGAQVAIDDTTPVTALVSCDRRYGVIAEALVVDKKAGARQRVRNEDLYARGGRSRRVFYVPAKSGAQAMRCTGAYQIERSKEGAETLTAAIAGRFAAAPGDTAAVQWSRLGVSGRFRVIELKRRFGEDGETSEVKLQRE